MATRLAVWTVALLGVALGVFIIEATKGWWIAPVMLGLFGPVLLVERPDWRKYVKLKRRRNGQHVHKG